MRRYATIVGVWVLLGLTLSSVAWASDRIRAVVSCPETANRQATVSVDITLQNNKAVAVGIPRGALVINTGTVTGTSPTFVGPLAFTIGVTVPPYGSVHLPLIPVMIPTSAKSDTFVSLGFGFLAAGNEVVGTGSCVIAIN